MNRQVVAADFVGDSARLAADMLALEKLLSQP
jgi:hypothetical protein